MPVRLENDMFLFVPSTHKETVTPIRARITARECGDTETTGDGLFSTVRSRRC